VDTRLHRIGICGYGYIHGYPRKICGYGYGYGCDISHPRQPCIQPTVYIDRRLAKKTTRPLDVLLKLTTDRHEASRSLFATAELLVMKEDEDGRGMVTEKDEGVLRVYRVSMVQQ